MRITSGSARNVTLRVPRGKDVRPATDYLRQAVFSSLADAITDAVMADCFAGCGAYGLEALSRGASHVTFVETNQVALGCLKSNLASVQKSIVAAGQVCGTQALHPQDVFRWKPLPKHFDLIIADPPYALLASHAERLISHLLPGLKSGGCLLLEGPGDFQLPRAYTATKRIGKGAKQPSVQWLLAD